jgi:hypothetical protein
MSDSYRLNSPKTKCVSTHPKNRRDSCMRFQCSLSLLRNEQLMDYPRARWHFGCQLHQGGFSSVAALGRLGRAAAR